MSQELPVVIKVDAPGALPMIASVEAALAKVENKGPAVGDALSRGLGAGAPAADKTKQSTDNLTQALAKMAASGAAFEGLASQFKREADMLEKIHGPAKQYQADLQALDGLLMRGAIDTEEYAQQVTKMNSAIEGAPEKLEAAESSTGKLGEAFEALKLPAVGAGILELGHKIAELAEAADRMQDRFTELHNKTLKFVEAGRSSAQVLEEQRQLSLELNTTIGPTIELYERVRIGSDNLRLSHEDQIRMTKTLGEATEQSNKPMEAAGEVMQRFSLAMESGVTDVRSVKQVMLELPEAAKVWQDTFHMTDQQILAAVQHGKLGARELAMAWAQEGEATKKIDEAQLARTRTNEEAVRQYTEAVNIAVQNGKSGFQAISEASLGKDAGHLYAGLQNEGFSALSGETDNGAKVQAVIDKMMAMADHARKLTDEFKAMGDAKDKAWSDMVETIALLPDGLMRTAAAAEEVASRVGLMSDAWDKSLSSFGRFSKIVMDHAASVGDAKLQLAALTEAMHKGGIAGDEARKQYEALQTTLNNGRLPAAIKIFDALHDPVRTHNEDLAATVALYNSASIGAVQYQAELLQLQNSDPGFAQLKALLDDDIKKYDEAAAAAKRYADAAKLGFDSPANHGMTVGITGHELNANALSDAKTFAGNDKAQADKQTQQEKEYIQVIDASAGPVDKYYDALLKIDNVKSLLSDDQYAHALANLKEQYGATVSPAEKLARELSQTNDLFAAGVISAVDYQHKLQAIGKEQEKIADSGHDFASGMSRGWHSIRDEVQDTATTIATSMKGAFDELNADIVSMVTTGQADWGKLATTVESDLAKMALQKVEGGIFDAVGGGSSGAVTGASASATMLAAAPGIGAAIGASAAAAMAVGSAASSAASVAGIAASSGLWSGGSFTIPHAANGFSGRVAGVAGTDTRLARLMVSPGETVQVHTPEQMAAKQRANSDNRGVTIVNKHDVRGELASAHADGSMDTSVLNILKRNAGAVQSLLRK